MSASRPSGGSGLVLQRVAGLVFLAVLAGLVGLSVAFYQKAFTTTVPVTLMADRAGNQLTPPADVKVDGVIVGEARSIEATPDGAKIELALDPDMAAKLPANVSARLLPKTLFGEKFVALQRPDTPQGRLTSGTVIPQDRSQTAIETETAINDLLPVLRTLKPAELSTTLNAVSTALRGRGDQIGSNLQLVRDYLVRFNPQLPTLSEDFRGLADLADTVDAATPDLLRFLDDISAVNRNLTQEQPQLDSFLRTTATAVDRLDAFVGANSDRFIRLPAESRPSLDLYERYAPEFPCLANGLTQSEQFIGNAFGTLQPGLHITLEVTKDQGGYVPDRDEPEYLDDGGPSCFGLPDPQVPAADYNFRDGYQDPPGTPEQTYRGGSGSRGAGVSPAAYSSSVAERRMVNAVVAPLLGVSDDDVPDVAQLLFAPVARGTTVSLTPSASRSAS